MILYNTAKKGLEVEEAAKMQQFGTPTDFRSRMASKM
jgi:hypothetical protein